MVWSVVSSFNHNLQEMYRYALPILSSEEKCTMIYLTIPDTTCKHLDYMEIMNPLMVRKDY